MKISHNMFILKLLTDLCAIRQNVRKKTLPDVVYNILVVKEFKNKETCLKINGKQTVKLRSGSIKFKNHFQRLAAPFRICPDFKCIVKKAKSSDRGVIIFHTLKSIRHIFLAVFLINLYILMINLGNQLFFTEENRQWINLLNQFLKNMSIAKKWWKYILIKI